jgi:hypothetical protein
VTRPEKGEHARGRRRDRYRHRRRREAGKPQGRCDARLGCRECRNQRRSGMVRRPAAPDGTARPANVEGMRAQPQERRPSRPVRRREGDGRQVDGAGDEGPPPSRPALESGAARRGTAPGERATGEGQRLDARKERKTRRGRHPRDRTVRPNPHGNGQTNVPERPEGQDSPNAAQDAWRPRTQGTSRTVRPSRPRFSEADGGRSPEPLPFMFSNGRPIASAALFLRPLFRPLFWHL